MTISRKEKIRRRILNALSEKVEPSNSNGIFIRLIPFRLTRKDKKHSGRYTPQIHQKGKFSEMIANAEEPADEYNDWGNYRDGWRHSNYNNKTHFFRKWRACCLSEEEVYQINKKIKKQRAIRKVVKAKIAVTGIEPA